MKRPVDDPLSKLHLPAGKSVVQGEQALAFVRARHNLGDGSDISRIERQQEFLSSAIRQATSSGVVANPKKLYEVLSAGTKSITTDPDLANFDSMMKLAVNVSEVSPDKVTFATVPWQLEPNGQDISWVPSQAQQLWDAIRNDQQWPPATTNGTDGKPLTAAPSAISVKVADDASVSGAGTRSARVLQAEGYNVSLIGDTRQKVRATTIEYNPNSKTQTAAARTLSYATGAVLAEVGRSGESITLIVGADVPATLKPVTALKESTAPAPPAKPRTAAETVCAT